MPPSTDPRIDAYIAEAADFARPILRHLRELVHAAAPRAAETIKWGMPHFVLGDRILCSMAAFKAHVAFGFWHQEMERQLSRDLGRTNEGMGLLGRIGSLKDLPSDSTLRRYISMAAELTRSAEPARPRAAKRPVAVRVPADLNAALRKRAVAAKHWGSFTPGKRRDYIEWITEAKRPETRAQRVATTVEWVAAGKARNWKYERC